MYFVADICCLCLSKNDITQNLINIDSKNESYYTKIKSYFQELDFGETIEDYKLCTQCCNMINLVYDFKNKCFSSLNVFKSYRSNISAINKANSELDNNNSFQSVSILNDSLPSEESFVKPDTQIESDSADQLNGNSVKVPRLVEEDEFSVSSESKNSDITKTISEVLLSDLSDSALNISVENIELDNLEVSESVKKFECTICQKRFMYYSALHKHIKSHKLVYNPKIENNSFDEERKNVYNIEDEILSTSTSTAEIDKPYNCQICLRKFSQFSSLISHRSIHNLNQSETKSTKKSQDDKVYKCKICLKTFNKRKSLIDHKEVHTIEKPFECEICSIKFDSFSVLINHRKKHL